MDIRITVHRFLFITLLMAVYSCGGGSGSDPVLQTNNETSYVSQADSLHFYRKLRGEVSGKTVSIDLTRERNQLFLRLEFIESGETIRFNGDNSIDSAGNVRLVQYQQTSDSSALRAEVSFTGQWNAVGETLSGTWKRGSVSENVTFRVDPATDYKRIRMAHADSTLGDCNDTPCLSIDLSWPDLSEYETIDLSVMGYVITTPGYDMLNRSASVDSFVANMARDYSQLFEEERRRQSDWTPIWSRDLNSVITFNKAGLLGIEMEDYTYLGGAHPNTTLILSVFDLRTGDRADLSLLFTPEALQELDALLIPKVRSRFEIPEHQTFEEFGLFINEENPLLLPEIFGLEPDGVRFVFNPYEIAPYVFGRTDILFTFDEIRHLINPDFLERIGR